MNTIIKITVYLSIILSQISYVYADTTIVTPPQTTKWISKTSADTITINNGNGNLITITITVDKPASTSRTSGQISSPGINVSNCGDTTHIDAGSSAVCTTKDSSNPVSFSSDSPTTQATGKYDINKK